MAVAMGVEVVNAVFAGFALVLAVLEEVVGLVAGAEVLEPYHVERFVDAAEGYVPGPLVYGSGALLDGLEVADAGLGLAFADGEGAVGKVEEHFAALQVVTGNGVGGVALGCVGEHEYRQFVLPLECLELLHEGEGAAGGTGAATEAGDVVDYEHAGFGGDEGVFEPVADELVVAGEAPLAGAIMIDDRAEEVGMKMVVAMTAAVVACAKLLLGKLEVAIQHGAGGCGKGKTFDGDAVTDAVADLHGEDGFAGVGIGKEDADLVFEPKVAEKLWYFGLVAAGVEPVGGAFDDECVVRVGLVGQELVELLELLFGSGAAHGAADELDLDGAGEEFGWWGGVAVHEGGWSVRFGNNMAFQFNHRDRRGLHGAHRDLFSLCTLCFPLCVRCG